MGTKLYPAGLLLLRIFAGFMFWQHGAQKLFGYFGGPLAPPFTLSWVVGAVEFLGAIAIAIGLFTRPVSAILALDMAIVYLTQFATQGVPVRTYGGEVATILAVIATLLALIGADRWSIDAILEKRQMGLAADPRSQPYFPAVMGSFRIVIGVLFLQHGMQKILGVLGGETYEFPNMRWFAGIIELVGGAAIAVGLFTVPLAFLCCGEMAFAYFINHSYRGFWPIQNQGERAVLFCYIFLFMFTAGAGSFALDSVFRRKGTRAGEPAIARH